jgi:hypothetical protein
MRMLLAAAVLASLAVPASASTFWPGTVVGVAWDDVLNARKWPSAQSQIIDAYNNGDSVSLTARCKNIITNQSFQIDGGQSANWKYARMRKANVWCQVVTPSGDVGWVRGSFVKPD